jgi:hypothetical protein
MSVSRCCRKDVYIELDYFVCEACARPCDTIVLVNTEGDGNNDATNVIGDDGKIAQITCIA